MQIKITLKVLKKGSLLPFSYQYELSSWVYKVLFSGDNEFTTFLHQKGYRDDKKNFKFFTFSRLYISNFEQVDDRMDIQCDEISFVISSLLDEVAQKLIIGLFQNQKIELGDRITKVPLVFHAATQLYLEIPSTQIELRTTSPLVVVEQTVNRQGKTHHKYLNPEDPKFEKFFFQNLLNKYQMARKHELISEIKNLDSLSLELTNQRINKRAIRIKAHTKAETTVIGYECGFKLKAPQELIRLGILSGFGRMNAMGFGATKIVIDK